MTYDVRNYGAKGDGKALNTASIQATIDDCAANGGGRVLISGGTYMTGTITLKANVELHITGDSVLLGSPRCEDYPERTDIKHVNTELLPRARNACMIFAEECKNISVTGMGKIDCNGTAFVKPVENYSGGWPFERIDAPTPPRVVFFTGCENVKVEDITMVNQPSGWSYWIHDCDYVTFDRCKINASPDYPNNDGIHINSSRNVTISNCSITCGDDCIVVRANNISLTENKVCERVVVTNCNLTSYACGIRIAWIHDGTIKNCSFSNIVMTDTNTGICMQLPSRNPEKRYLDEGREATLIENLTFNNIIMDRTYAAPVRISIADKDFIECTAIRNIHFDNIHCKGLSFPWILGRERNKVQNITFSNCSFIQVSESELPNYKDHGAAAWDRPIDKPMLKFAENVVFNNTSFSTEQ